ncbi:uncharacterized protein BKCO1_35000127 [Diplodia corticola]|uniref:Uncharacterized protein n=1 Tax=Diplodia corticola TaxID=236234 RepID=A0A1J9RYE1_9PEZI|nr:uncharacterized protein BKCO1_35000127 [Diplodia corticola]OJD32828.1 hypothetical protein BKCO1_35000127 [Diplodia corticola]
MCTETLHLYRCGHPRGGAVAAARRRIEPCSRALNGNGDVPYNNAPPLDAPRLFERCPRFRVVERRHAAHACPDCRATKVDGLAARLQQCAAERVRERAAAAGARR